MREPRDPLTLDPETWVAAEILKAQRQVRPGPPPLPGMTPPVFTHLLVKNVSPAVRAAFEEAGRRGKLRISKHSIGSGPTCINCNCGRKDTE